MAVLLPPLSFQTRGTVGDSPSVATAITPVRHYAEAIYTDRGYAFFGPDPGPSHLIQAAVANAANQSETKPSLDNPAPPGTFTEIMIPDLAVQWPRLLYHRHFMLSEFFNETYQPPGPPPRLFDLDPQAARQWQRLRSRHESLHRSIVHHLSTMSSGRNVSIRRLEHIIPDLAAYQQQPISLADPQLFRVLLDQPLPETPEGLSNDGAAKAEDNLNSAAAAQLLTAPQDGNHNRGGNEGPAEPAPTPQLGSATGKRSAESGR